MDESRRKRLIAYCPEVELISRNPFLLDSEKAALIMSALISAIISKGEWEEFMSFVWKAYVKAHPKEGGTLDCSAWLIHPPAHFAEVVGEWLELKEG